jgi:hypothetical protein
MMRIIAQLVGSVFSAGVDRRPGHLRAREQVEDLDRAVAVTHPDFAMADDQRTVGTGGVVVSRGADENAGPDLREAAVVGVDDIERLVRAVGQHIDAERRIDEADVERSKCCARYSDSADDFEAVAVLRQRLGHKQRRRERASDKCKLPQIHSHRVTSLFGQCLSYRVAT